jgi:hypothetical protein
MNFIEIIFEPIGPFVIIFRRGGMKEAPADVGMYLLEG